MLTQTLCTASVGSLVAAGGVNIDFDLTFVIQMALFSLLLVGLKPVLFDPLLRVFEQREAKTEGTKAEARRLQEKAGELMARYEKELERVAQVAAEEREKLRAETSRLENEILEEARVTVARIVGEGRKKIDDEAAAMRFELGRQSERMATEMASSVLGRELS